MLVIKFADDAALVEMIQNNNKTIYRFPIHTVSLWCEQQQQQGLGTLINWPGMQKQMQNMPKTRKDDFNEDFQEIWSRYNTTKRDLYTFDLPCWGGPRTKNKLNRTLTTASEMSKGPQYHTAFKTPLWRRKSLLIYCFPHTVKAPTCPQAATSSFLLKTKKSCHIIYS